MRVLAAAFAASCVALVASAASAGVRPDSVPLRGHFLHHVKTPKPFDPARVDCYLYGDQHSWLAEVCILKTAKATSVVQ